jgi:hypothetical protein
MVKKVHFNPFRGVQMRVSRLKSPVMKQRAPTTPEIPSKPLVRLSAVTLHFSLPTDFGVGWGYEVLDNDRGLRTPGNFATDALRQIHGIGGIHVVPGVGCGVDFEVFSLENAQKIEAELTEIAQAFQKKEQLQVSMRGRWLEDHKVTVFRPGVETPIMEDIPRLVYMAKHVPLAERHPVVDGRDLKALVKEWDEAVLAQSKIQATPAQRFGPKP